MKKEVPIEEIERFLEGKDPQKYIVGVETSYGSQTVKLIINDPEKGKIIENGKLKPFFWAKAEGIMKLCKGERGRINQVLSEKQISVKKMKIAHDNGDIPQRMGDGFTYLVQGNCSYGDMINVFKRNGCDIFDQDNRKDFITMSIVEQYLIQTGKRLFKGMDDYNDIHRLQFDLETTGLEPKAILLSEEEIKKIQESIESSDNPESITQKYIFRNKRPYKRKGDTIFSIGIKDNRGHEFVLEVRGETEEELRDKELLAIETFFAIVDELKPDLIAGYNSENFDFQFIKERCHQLGSSIEAVATTLSEGTPIKRKNSTIKYGQETEFYEQTIMWGYNIIDIMHAVRRAQAINSNIKKAGLKYITQYSKIAKPNRVYVEGDMIYKTWADTENKYAHNDDNGDWYVINENHPLKSTHVETTGAYIVKRYLLDDLWETEQVDFSFNQASFLLAKIVPTSYSKVSTMGTASLWKLLMCGWSYENKLGVPDYQDKREFTGGLSRLLECGYAVKVIKLDYAALYPNEQLTHDIFPKFDISGVMKSFLLYIAETRDKYKALMNKAKARKKEIETKMFDLESKGELTPELKRKCEGAIIKHSKLAADYDKKQLPIKILANSFFGSLGAPYIFPWGDINCAEEITCRGRQDLRLLVSHFWLKYNFRPLVGDSVTKDMPIYIKYNKNNLIGIVPISDLFKEVSIDVNGQQRDLTQRDFKILTNNGWKKLDYVYRHKTDKTIYDIRTQNSHIRVTEDHSIFQNGVKILPSKLKIGDKIDIYDIPINNSLNNISLNKAWLLGIFVGNGSAVYSNYKNDRKRSEWVLNNLTHEHLNKAKCIVKEEYGINTLIKNSLKSNNVFKLKTYFANFSKEFTESCYTNREKCVPLEILNSTKEIKDAFLDGFMCTNGNKPNIINNQSFYQKSITNIGGLSYLMKSVGLQYNIELNRYDYDKGLYGITLNTPTKNIIIDNNTIIWKEIFPYDDYVYDVSTEDGSFIGGIGGVSCSNTDGFNFAVPDNVDTFEYVGQGIHRFTEKGKLYKGANAPVAEFNDLHMKGRMGLDIDEVAEATINFSRKNYADLIDGDVKLVGNSIKSKKMEVYIEEFFDIGIRLLLEGKGKEFINLYYEHVDKIYNYQIPLAKIASKGRVKQSITEYKKKCKTLNKAGNPMPRQAHMELVLAHGLTPDLGDTIYYVNVGKAKSMGDIKSVKLTKELPFEKDKEYKVNGKRAKFMVKKINYNTDPKNKKQVSEIISFNGYFTNKKESKTEIIPFEKLKPETALTGKVEVELNCILIPREQINNNPELTTDDYNVSRYLDKFNKRLKPLLVVFDPEIRDNILITVKNDKVTKTEMLEDKSIFTKKECKLTAGMPYNKEDQDTFEELMSMEDKEIRFWTSVDKIPNNIDLDEWEGVVDDYSKRIKQTKRESLIAETLLLHKKFQMLEVSDLDEVTVLMGSDPDAYRIWLLDKFKVDVDFDENKESFYFKSYKWVWDDSKFTNDIPNYLCGESEMFNYREQAEERAIFYQTINLQQILENGKIKPYQIWLDNKDTQLAEKENLTLEEYRKKNSINNIKLKPIKPTQIDYVDEDEKLTHNED